MSQALLGCGARTLAKTLSLSCRLSNRPLSILCHTTTTCTRQGNPRHSLMRNIPDAHQQGPCHVNNISCRNIFTDKALGIDKIEHLQGLKEQLFTPESGDRYIKRIANYVESGNYNALLRDDLINMIGLATEEKHLDIIEQMVINSNGDQASFFNSWGSAVMRLYYMMKQAERAERNIKDIERFKDFFNIRSCYKTIMSWMYEIEHYDKVYEIYQLSLERRAQEPKFAQPDRELILIVLAALAKAGDAQSFQRAKEIFKSLPKDVQGIRIHAFVSYLAYKNNDFSYALNVISSNTRTSYVTIRDLELVCLAKLHRHEDLVLRIRQAVDSHKRGGNFLMRTTYESIQDAKAHIKEENLRQDLDDLLIEIQSNNYIQDVCLEELIFRPISEPRVRPLDNRFQGRRYNSYESENRPHSLDDTQDRPFRSRPERTNYGDSLMQDTEERKPASRSSNYGYRQK